MNIDRHSWLQHPGPSRPSWWPVVREIVTPETERARNVRNAGVIARMRVERAEREKGGSK